MKKFLLALAIICCILFAACTERQEPEASNNSSSASSDTTTAENINVFIDYSEKTYTAEEVVEIPFFAVEGGSSGEVDNLNNYLSAEVNDYVETLRQMNDEEFDGSGGLSVMSYPITSEKYVQVATLSTLYTMVDSATRLATASYDVANNKYLTLDDAYSMANTTKDEVVEQVKELAELTPDIVLSGDPIVAGFIIKEETEEYVEFFIYVNEKVDSTVAQRVYSYAPSISTATRLDVSALFTVDTIDATEEPLRRHYDYELNSATALMLVESSANLGEDYSYSIDGEAIISGNMCTLISATSPTAEPVSFAVTMFANIYIYTEITADPPQEDEESEGDEVESQSTAIESEPIYDWVIYNPPTA